MIFRERHLQMVWGLGLYCREGMRTEDGRGVVVEDPGIPNRGRGPDFRDARLRIGAGQVCGDVELHLWSDGWIQHRHDETGAYSSVVLHVALDRGRRSCPGSIPELILSPALRKSRLELVRDLERIRVNLPVDPLPDFAKLGEIRFERKVKRLHQVRALDSPGQIFYRAVLTGLGYGSNRASFEELSRLVPLARLQGRGRTEMETLLLNRARTLSWRISGVRPANHPFRRISGVVRWLTSVPLDRPHEPHMEDPTGASFDPTGEGYIGRQCDHVLRNNVVLPFTVGFGNRRLRFKALDLFRSLPSGPSHRRLKDAQNHYRIPPPRFLRQEWGVVEGFERRHS